MERANDAPLGTAAQRARAADTTYELARKVALSSEVPKHERVFALNHLTYYLGQIDPISPQRQNPYHLKLVQLIDQIGLEDFPYEGQADRMLLSSARRYAGSVWRIEDPQEIQEMADAVDWIFTIDRIDTDHPSFPGFIEDALGLYSSAGQQEKADQVRKLLDAQNVDRGENKWGELHTRLRQARAGQPLATDDPEVIQSLQDLWADLEARDNPLSMVVASNLLSALRHVDARDAAIVVAIDASNLYLDRKKAWEAEAKGIGQLQLAQAERLAPDIMYQAISSAHWREHAEALLSIADAYLEHHASHRFSDRVEQRRNRFAQYLNQ